MIGKETAEPNLRSGICDAFGDAMSLEQLKLHLPGGKGNKAEKVV